MAWIGERVRDEAYVRAYDEVAGVAAWSPWLSLGEAVAAAPRRPGVYLLRDPTDQVVRYAGRAGDRAGGGRPQGLHGRLAAYLSGHEGVSGFAEAALDRALADPAWVRERSADPRTARRTRRWAAAAVLRLAPDVSWAPCGEAADARLLETEVVALLRPFGLWNH